MREKGPDLARSREDIRSYTGRWQAGRASVAAAQLASATCADVDALGLGHRRPHQGDQGRPVGLAPVGHRGQVGRVGLDQQPVERAQRGGRPHVVGRPKVTMPLKDRQAPRSRHGRASSGPPVKQWNTVRARHALGVEDGEGVVPGLAGVDHQGQVVRVGQRDLGRERLALRGAGRVVVVVVEAALPHRHHLGVAEQLDRARRRRRLASWGWTPAVAHTPVVAPRPRAMAWRGVLDVGADGDQPGRPRPAAASVDGVGAVGASPGEVAVVVGPAHGGRRSRLGAECGGTAASPFSTGRPPG